MWLLFVFVELCNGVSSNASVLAPQGLLLDLDVSWPLGLKRWMSWLNILNINLQLMRPECTGPFGVYEKLSIALTFPIGFVALLSIYVAIQYALSKRMTNEQRVPKERVGGGEPTWDILADESDSDSDNDRDVEHG